MNALKGSLAPGVNIIDQIHINPDVDALDFSNAGPIFKDSASITDFNLTVDGDTVTLAGTAASQDQKNMIEHEAVQTWPGLNVVDKLVFKGPPPPSALPAPCRFLVHRLTIGDQRRDGRADYLWERRA
jgi:peptidoglycan-binding protein ArfA